MVAIVRSLGIPAAELENLCRVPAADELRPSQCPACGRAAGLPGALNLVGHGFYRRQLLGLDDVPRGVVIFVRRFFCRNCKKTTSVLPPEVHPRRWYAGAAIIAALVRHLILGWSADQVREALGAAPGARAWRTLRRWKAQFLGPLWFWKAAELGAIDEEGASPPLELLHRFLMHLGAPSPRPPDVSMVVMEAAAEAAVLGTVHKWPERELVSRTV